MQLKDHGEVGQHPFTVRAKVRDSWRKDPEPGSTGPVINQPQDPWAGQLQPRAAGGCRSSPRESDAPTHLSWQGVTCLGWFDRIMTVSPI